ncbi:hypothetical protein Q5H91_04050 [Sphingomonas sp. KR1UV-12]|uniref:XRE family transcriptional regulator n=1 Tax=Sphingomonas aurea TaxID=3063994 RepID=A0ABT9EHH9_9SPHN|nr:hypothetical protein [Sphingomonas sp. KR1UV-12]MDP1026374.1 hypothetical protein [Sphingomonas sp. KR1UV-12]
MKLHLRAKAPSEGARLLVRWIMGRHGGDVARAAERLMVSDVILCRIVEGDVVPGIIVGTSLQRHCDIRARHFSQPPVRGWFDEADAAPLAEAA